ncbi:MAG TPA: glycosyltransferase [Burkholderiaceae bacterium]
MRIVIDMQGAQTSSRLRGIGRYTWSLIEAMVRNRGEHEIVLALSGLLHDSVEPIRSQFAPLIGRDNIQVWDAPGPTQETDPYNKERRERAELVREAFLASLRPDVLYVASFFEGYVDDAVTSLARFDRSTPVAVSFYDLIPYLYQEQYLQPDAQYKQYYLRKLKQLQQADLLLAISESSRHEAIAELGYPERQIVNVSTAADAHFKPQQIAPGEKQALLAKYGITRAFVMYTGATDSRKNVEGLIRSYALLSEDLRAQHQLVITGAMQARDRQRLEALADTHYLLPGELQLAGFVSDEDLVKLYNLCELFIFPSWHEGFGLPALEAMACGKAVIASDSSSLPEVIGRADAMFDAKNDKAIADKITEVLRDGDFRTALEAHGLERAKLFSWDISAKRAIAALENLHAERRAASRAPAAEPAKKKTLAYVSPLPPERTGIANYSVELLPALRAHYDITLIVKQDACNLPPALQDLPVQSSEWFAEHGASFDRVIYQVGNSPFHTHMLPLMERHPGVVVMHDFFISSMLAAEELERRLSTFWSDELYHSHGYHALVQRYADGGVDPAKDKFPCNLGLLQRAAGVIVHSAHSARLTADWYGPTAAQNLRSIPHLRLAWQVADRDAARRAAREKLGIAGDSFVVCSFGFIGPTKLSHRLLDAWLQSGLAVNRQCELVLVGENHGGDYGRELARRIRDSGSRERIRIAGWTEMKDYELYLQAADIGVQLRSVSRGETSGAVLDCMNYGLPTIVNAHGSMADLSDTATWKLADEFTDADLVVALDTLWRDKARREAISREALHVIATLHAPAYCAQEYAYAIEEFHPLAKNGSSALIARLGETLVDCNKDATFRQLANSLARSLPMQPRLKQILVDVSTIARSDLQTGIERVVRAQLSELLVKPPAGYRVEPVYLHTESDTPHYRYARRYTHSLLDLPQDIALDAAVDVAAGDVFYGADFCPADVIKAATAGIYEQWRLQGARVGFLIHDILPVTRPEFFPEHAGDTHALWLSCIAEHADRLLCISQAVADEMQAWLKREGKQTRADFPILHHGADIAASFPSKGMPGDAAQVLNAMRQAPSFLMVGTIEPRKGHLQALQAFEKLWQEGSPAMLVIVGREGWTGLPQHLRRTIPQTVEALRKHPELGKRLIWLADISDEYLEQVYQAATCLLFSSEAEGFGLPLIEAAKFKRPILARDIPVFREIAGDHACYFSGAGAEELAAGLREWLALQGQGKAPQSDGMPWFTWAQNAERLAALLAD